MRFFERFFIGILLLIGGVTAFVSSPVAQAQEPSKGFYCLGHECPTIPQSKPQSEPIAGCGKPGDVGNEKGVGKYCTKGGGQCAGLEASNCSVDFKEGPGLCSKQCSTNADCGSGATCVDETFMGIPIKGCKPNACNSLTTSPTVTQSAPITSVSPSTNPCLSNPTSETLHSKGGKEKSQGLIVKIIELFIKFFELLLNLFSGGTPPPTIPPSPNDTQPSPTIDPCITAAPTIEEPSITSSPSETPSPSVSEPSITTEPSITVEPSPSITSPEPSVTVPDTSPTITVSPTEEVPVTEVLSPTVTQTPGLDDDADGISHKYKGLIERLLELIKQLLELILGLVNEKSGAPKEAWLTKEPDFKACDAGMETISKSSGLLIANKKSNQFQTYEVPLAAPAQITILGYSKEGHPEDCPKGPGCKQSQKGEEFTVAVNGKVIGETKDQGAKVNAWIPVGPWTTTEQVTTGTVQITIAHKSVKSNQPDSVDYKLTVCAESDG